MQLMRSVILLFPLSGVAKRDSERDQVMKQIGIRTRIQSPEFASLLGSIAFLSPLMKISTIQSSKVEDFCFVF